MRINFSTDQYMNFMSILTILKNTCSDVSIVDGKIFQENDKHSLLYDIDLTTLFGGMTIYFDTLCRKYDLLDMFRRQNSVMSLEITDKKYIWADKYSSVEFMIPNVSNLKLKPISKNSNIAKVKTSISENKIFECCFDHLIVEKIVTASAASSLDTTDILLILNENIATFCMTMGGNNSSSVCKVYTIDDINESLKGVLKLPIQPFIIKMVEKLNIFLGKNIENNDNMTLNVNTKINNIDINMWMTSLFKEK